MTKKQLEETEQLLQESHKLLADLAKLTEKYKAHCEKLLDEQKRKQH